METLISAHKPLPQAHISVGTITLPREKSKDRGYPMRITSLVILCIAIFPQSAVAQSGEVRCPVPKTQFKYSDGGAIESLEMPGPSCVASSLWRQARPLKESLVHLISQRQSYRRILTSFDH